ncbi:MAG: tRNA epoxyqueuosine(34) reductase QueG [Planctomycetota bacterium]
MSDWSESMRNQGRSAGFIKSRARELGFDAAGIASAAPSVRAGFVRMWLAGGCHAGMSWLARNVEQRLDPGLVLPGARSVVMVARRYPGGTECPAPPAGHGSVARYARGCDYHRVMMRDLRRLLADIRTHAGDGVSGRVFTDTAPVLERELAARAGLGWVGKHTNLVSPAFGNWFFIGGILLDIELPADNPLPDRCGRCRRCLDACPTGALVAPRTLDARRCLAYLTIEHRGGIPVELRPRIGNRVFGCDACLAACPWNRFSPAGGDPHDGGGLDLVRILGLSAEAFNAEFRGSAVRRATWMGLRRNAAVCLGNDGGPVAAGALARILEASDPDPVVRAHAAWALGRCGTAEAHGIRIF